MLTRSGHLGWDATCTLIRGLTRSRTLKNHAFTGRTSFWRLHFWFIWISFHFFFPKFQFPNSGCGLSASVAYMPVFTVLDPLPRGTQVWMNVTRKSDQVKQSSTIHINTQLRGNARLQRRTSWNCNTCENQNGGIGLCNVVVVTFRDARLTSLVVTQ